MRKETAELRADCEKIFAQALRPVASELRLVDLDALMHHVKAGEHESIADIVASCAEPYFTPGALHFALAADARASWENGGCVSLDLEFQAEPVTAFLRLTLGPRSGGVDLLGLHAPGAQRVTRSLVESAIRRARLDRRVATATGKPARRE
jgi:hypothetical protein